MADNSTDRHKVFIGVALMTLGCGLITLNDAIMKSLINVAPLGQLIFIRSIGSLLLLAIVFPFFGSLHDLKPRSVSDVFKSASLLMAGLIIFPISLYYISLTEALTIIYLSPIITAALSPWIIGERPNINQFVSVIVGFIGVFLVLQPYGYSFNIAYTLPLIVAIIIASRDVLMRRISIIENSFTITGVGTLLSAILSLCSSLLGWNAIPAIQIITLIFCGVVLAIGHVMAVKAFSHAEASIISSMKYSSIPWSIFMSYVMFSEILNVTAFVGVIVVVCSGVTIVMCRDNR